MRGSSRRARPGLGRCLSQALVGDGRSLEPPNTRRPKPRVCRGHARLILHRFKRNRQRPRIQLQPMRLADHGILGHAKFIANFREAVAARMQFAQPINHSRLVPWARIGAHGWRLALCCAQRARRYAHSPSTTKPSATLKAPAEMPRHIAALIISSPPPKSPLLLWQRRPNPAFLAAAPRVQLP